jgi:hypothetical protein
VQTVAVQVRRQTRSYPKKWGVSFYWRVEVTRDFVKAFKVLVCLSDFCSHLDLESVNVNFYLQLVYVGFVLSCCCFFCCC